MSRKTLQLWCCLAGIGLLAGCNPNRVCDKPQKYHDSVQAPDLQVPSDLSGPDESQVMTIPGPTGGSQALYGSGNCLDLPPKYFDRPGAVAGSPEALIYDWADAWSAKDVDTFFSYYSFDFQPGEGSLESWRETRMRQLRDPAETSVTVTQLSLAPAPGQRMVARFTQNFQTSTGGFSVRKEVALVKQQRGWRIQSERVVEVL